MKKLRLDLDALTVTSFDVAREMDGAGTVEARELVPTNGNTCATCLTNCGPYC